MDYGILSIVPPVLAIVLAIMTRNVVVSLLIGIFTGYLIINDFVLVASLVAFFEGTIVLLADPWNAKILAFALFVGAMLKLMVSSGGVDGLVQFLTKKQKGIHSKKGALLLAYVIGVVIFVEASITTLIAGAVARPLTDQFGASREKLAYVCDSTSAPVCSLIPLNAWGIFLVGLIAKQVESGAITGSATELFIKSIPFNFYAILTLIFVLYIILTEKDFASMKAAELAAKPRSLPASDVKGNMWKMILPLLVLLFTLPIGFYVSGDGITSIFYAVSASLTFGFVYYVVTKTMTVTTWFGSVYKGALGMLPIAIVLFLAFSIGSVIESLDTAYYLAALAGENLNPIAIPMVIFILSGMIALSTGTSWGTFSIMMPIAITFSVVTGEASIALVIAAVISGGIFGDHCSPISDTTIISSMASKCNHMSHVNTQLPYALLTGGASALLFLIAGFVLS